MMNCKQLSGLWRLIVTYGLPLILLPLPMLWKTKEAYCAYGVLLMAGYWLTEALPLPITGFLPIVIFPIMGIAGVKDLAKHYIKDTNLVFLGGLIMAVSLEHCGLHKRLGLTVLQKVGTSPKRLLSGFMLATWVLSMLISNTATAAMMIPVVNAILVEMSSTQHAKYANNSDISVELTTKSERQDDYDGQTIVVKFLNESADIKKESENSPMSELDSGHSEEPTHRLDMTVGSGFARMMCLSIAITCNIGGTATLTGSGTNLVLYEAADDLYSKYNMTSPVNFSTWLFYGVPSSIFCLLVAWIWLQIVFLGFRRTFTWKTKQTHSDAAIVETVRRQYDSLGRISFSEICNIFFLALLLLLWLTRDPGFIPGWSHLFPVKRFVTDSVPVFLIVIIMFTAPSQQLHKESGSNMQYDALINWGLLSTKVPWGPLFTLGGGFAMAEACKVSGLNELISNQLASVKDAPTIGILFLVVYTSVLLTQIVPNIPASALTLPIIAELGLQAGIPPLQLMFPANLAASYAFSLPVSTPPNAIVFSYGHVTSLDMAKTGFVLSLLCALVVTLGAVSWGPFVMDMQLDITPSTTMNYTASSDFNMSTATGV